MTLTRMLEDFCLWGEVGFDPLSRRFPLVLRMYSWFVLSLLVSDDMVLSCSQLGFG